jgi:hypothetical protein
VRGRSVGVSRCWFWCRDGLMCWRVVGTRRCRSGRRNWLVRGRSVSMSRCWFWCRGGLTRRWSVRASRSRVSGNTFRGRIGRGRPVCSDRPSDRRCATAVEFTWPWGCRYIGPSVVDRGQQSPVCTSGVLVLHLFRGHRNVRLLCRRHFRCSRSSIDSTGAAIETDAVGGVVVIDDGRVVNVVDDRSIYVGHAGVVVVLAAPPIATVEPGAGVTETVVNSAIEADHRPPIADIPDIGAVRKCPVSRGPEQTDLGRKYPRAWDPVVAVINVVRPITRHPDVTRSRAKRLCIDWQKRGANPNRYSYAYLWWIWVRSRRFRNNQERGHQGQRTKQIGDTHNTHLSGVGWAFSGYTVRPIATLGRTLIRTLQWARKLQIIHIPFVDNKLASFAGALVKLNTVSRRTHRTGGA